MYRIFFTPAVGKFVIQVIHLGMLWVSVKSQDEEVMYFDTFDEATKHVSRIGLDQLYQNRSENLRQRYLSA